MRNITRHILPLILVFSIIPARAETIEVVDDMGNTVKLKAPAKRIISLAPHITENLFSAGAGHLIVGAVNFSDYPDEARKIPPVGGYNNFDVELIFTLQPDLVIAWKEGNQLHQVEKLQELGLTVYVNEPRRLEDVAGNIIRFGILTGHEEKSRVLADDFIKQISALRNRYSGLEKVSVFYQVWHTPLITVTDNQIIGDVIRLCGGRNIFADLKTLTPQIGIEAVLARNPEAIVASGMGEARPDWLDDWKQWGFLKAVADDNLFFINPDIIQRHTARILTGARQMCEDLQSVRNGGDEDSFQLTPARNH